MDRGELRAIGPGAARERDLDLLLLADESAAQVASCLLLGDLPMLEDATGGALGLTLALYDGSEAELKAAAARPNRQGQGIGKRTIALVLARLRVQDIRRVTVATGNSGFAPLALYQKCGLRLARIERDFFSPERGYPEGMEENGILLRGRVWLDRAL
ncbi:MAG: GNAT family N-acetyltransferase [Thermomicrobiales bacterium]|nr:GNAT family N-acetyltransferase [Thermomicrobiales bacterium]